MYLTDRYQYRKLERITQVNGIRHYTCPITNRPLVSVTTVLDQTSTKPELLEWRQRVGDKKADQIKKEAVDLGSLMHTHLERHINNQARPGGNNLIRVMAQQMADQIIQRGLVHIDEVWGCEVALFYPGLFAGSTDLVGIYNGQPAIIDFKTAKKLRSRDMIEDYFLQLCAYSLCHNELYSTTISTGVIFMVDRENNFQDFVIEGVEFHAAMQKWFTRLECYLSAHS